MAAGIIQWATDRMIAGMNAYNKFVYQAYLLLIGSSSYDLWDQVVSVFVGALKPFCYSLIGIFFMIECIQTLMRSDMLKWEEALKLGIRLIFSKIIIDAAPEVLKAIYYQSISWVTSIASSAGVFITSGRSGNLNAQMQSIISTEIMDQYAQVISDSTTWGGGLGATLLTAVVGIILWLVMQVCGILVYVMVFARMFQIYMYVAVSPVPCAFFPMSEGGPGFSRVTISFFKNFAACCLQGVMIMLGLLIYGFLINDIMGTFISSMTGATTGGGSGATEIMGTIMVATLTLVLVITKCSSWAKEALGSA